MQELNINLFLSAAADSEYCQYVLLAELKKTAFHLHSNRVYPSLSSLIELKNTLQELIEKKEGFEGLLPKKLSEFDIKNQQVVYENTVLQQGAIDKVFDFISWGLPKINEVVEEGKIIYRFVKENMKIEEVGLVPLYKNEGYFIIPDLKIDTANIYRFEVPLLAMDINSASLIRFELVKQMSHEEMLSRPLREIKLELIRGNPELPNPATYSFLTDLDFSFSDTMLPIAKRRLLKKLVN